MTTQNARLLQYLKKNKRGISQLEAFNKLGICRLSERIRELQGWGKQLYRSGESHCISHQSERVKTRYGYATVTRYKLA